MDLIERIEHLLESTMSAVKEAAERCDVQTLQRLTRRGQRLKELKDRFAEFDEEVRGLESESSDGGRSDYERPPVMVRPDAVSLTTGSTKVLPISNARRMVIEVTQGMINQNLLTLTEHVNSGRIHTGTEMKIEAKPSGELFCTDLLSDGNRLRERGAIGRFYQEAKVRAGDKVVLAQESPNRWTLEKFGQPSVSPAVHQSNDQI